MRKILFILSEWGYWGEDLIGPLEACDNAGYEITFVTPTGKKPVPLGTSMSPGFIDPPLGKSVTSPEMAENPAGGSLGPTRSAPQSGGVVPPPAVSQFRHLPAGHGSLLP